LRVVDGIGGDPAIVGLITTIVSWPEKLTGLVKDVFNLTASEADVLRALSLGQSVKEIAVVTGRSELTIRSHVGSILTKTETRSQVELIRMTLGLLEAAEVRPAAINLTAASLESHKTSSFSTLILEDQRRLDYLVIGDPRGKPVILMPGGVGASPFTPKHERELTARGIRMILPIRAGFGRSSPLPAGRHAHEVAAADTFALMDHLGIQRLPFVTICDDFCIAIALAATKPGRMSAIVGCGASMPAVTHVHYSRMSKWRRFASANARYAPRALPYLGLALFSRLRRMGPNRVLNNLLAESPADLSAIRDNDVLAAILRGAEDMTALSTTVHVTWAAETAAAWSNDWSDKLRNCTVPITLFAGHQDPLSPYETVKEYAGANPNIRLRDFPDCGQLMYPYIDQLFDTIEESARATA
jgi:pimeloyl-ACP methyl ester carboxylesterase/DNA-binding CsgD family transcriptional regulator